MVRIEGVIETTLRNDAMNLNKSFIWPHLARTIHKHARALACSLILREIILNRPDQ